MLGIYFLCSFVMFSQPKPNLEVEIRGIEEYVGVIRLAVYDTSGTFLKDEGFVYYAIAEVDNRGSCKIGLGVPNGRYAISVFQDLNEDEQINKNFFGIPTEPYGFSNDVMGLLGPPSFVDASFEVSGDAHLVITLR